MGTSEGTVPTVGVLINQLEGRYQSILLKGFRHYADKEKIRLVFFVGKALNSPYSDENSYNSVYGLAKESGIDGIIAVAGSIGNFLKHDENKAFLEAFSPFPVLTIGTAVSGIPAIITDNSIGIKSLVQHFILHHQYRRIAYLSGPENNPDSLARLSRFRAEMRTQGQHVDEAMILTGDFSFQSGFNATEKLVKRNQPIFDAVICSNDEMALGFLDAMERKGLFAPRDFAISGFDNINEAHFTSPPLTTVHQSLYRQAILACENICKMIRKEPVSLLLEEPSRMILRESCGCGNLSVIPQLPLKNTEDQGILSKLDTRTLCDSILHKTQPPDDLSSEIRNAVSALLENLILDLKSYRHQPLLLMALHEWLSLTLQWEHYAEIWLRILQNCHYELLLLLSEEKAVSYVHALFQQAYASVALRTAQKESRTSGKLQWQMLILQEITRELNSPNPLSKSLNTVRKQLELLGISDLQIFTPEPSETVKADEYLLKFGLKETAQTDSERSLCSVLSPEEPDMQYSQCHYLHPLVYQNDVYGYVLFSGYGVDPFAMDTIRNGIAQNLYSQILSEEKRQKDAELDEMVSKLRRSESRYRDMADLVPMIVIETNSQLKMSFMNRAAENFFNIKDDLFNLKQIIPPEDRERLENILMELSFHKEISTYPGIRFHNKELDKIIPVAQIKGVYQKETNQLVGIRWHAFDPLPFIRKSLLPEKEFFIKYRISDRELDVIQLVLQGLPNREISEKLFISESTVKGHLTQIYSKFGVSGKTEMIRLIQDRQVKTHGYSEYLFTVLNSLLSGST